MEKVVGVKKEGGMRGAVMEKIDRVGESPSETQKKRKRLESMLPDSPLRTRGKLSEQTVSFRSVKVKTGWRVCACTRAHTQLINSMWRKHVDKPAKMSICALRYLSVCECVCVYVCVTSHGPLTDSRLLLALSAVAERLLSAHATSASHYVSSSG